MNQAYINHSYDFLNPEGLGTLKSKIRSAVWTIDQSAENSPLVKIFMQDVRALTSKSPGDYQELEYRLKEYLMGIPVPTHHRQMERETPVIRSMFSSLMDYIVLLSEKSGGEVVAKRVKKLRAVVTEVLERQFPYYAKSILPKEGIVYTESL